MCFHLSLDSVAGVGIKDSSLFSQNSVWTVCHCWSVHLSTFNNISVVYFATWCLCNIMFTWSFAAHVVLLHLQYVSIYAAYLYDAVMLYAKALDALLQRYENVTDDVLNSVAKNGTLIIEMLKNNTYESECTVLSSSLSPTQVCTGTVWWRSQFWDTMCQIKIVT